MSYKIETLESKEAERLISKFKSEIDIESATSYDPRNVDDLNHLAKCMAIIHVKLLLELENVHHVFWVGVKEHLEIEQFYFIVYNANVYGDVATNELL